MNSHGMLADRDVLLPCTPYSLLRVLFFTASLVSWFSRVNLKTRCRVCEVQRTLWSLVNQAKRNHMVSEMGFRLVEYFTSVDHGFRKVSAANGVRLQLTNFVATLETTLRTLSFSVQIGSR